MQKTECQKPQTANRFSQSVVKRHFCQNGITIHYTDAGDAGLFVAAVVSENTATKKDEGIALRLYEAVANILLKKSAVLVHERAFVSRSSTKNLLSSRREILDAAVGLDPNTPLSVVQASPCFGKGVAGSLFHAVPARLANTETLRNENQSPIGRRWSTDFADYLVLQPRCRTTLTPDFQIEDFFERAALILNRHGFHFSDVARTWFYINNILENYHTFNRVRDQKYAEFGLTQSNPPRIPASTGIEGADVNGSALVADLLAVKPRQNKIRFLSNPQQKEAFEYGAAFSRAALIQEKEADLIQVSGTAAIGEDGKTLYPDDGASQIACTLDKFEALLDTAGACLDHVATANIFVKHPMLFETFKLIAKERGITLFPGVPVVADICRGDLLFEIDAEVVVPKS